MSPTSSSSPFLSPHLSRLLPLRVGGWGVKSSQCSWEWSIKTLVPTPLCSSLSPSLAPECPHVPILQGPKHFLGGEV